jgi:hypothetical protein
MARESSLARLLGSASGLGALVADKVVSSYDAVEDATVVHGESGRAAGSPTLARAQSGLTKPVEPGAGDRRPNVIRLTYTEVKLHNEAQLREAAKRRLIETMKSGQPGIWRFPRALGLRFATFRPAV